MVGSDITDWARDVVVVDPLRPTRPVHQRGHVPPAERQPAADRGGCGNARSGPRAGNRDRVLRVVPDQDGEVDFQQPTDFLGYRGEYRLRRRPAGDQHRYPAQGRLLPDNPVISGSSQGRNHHGKCMRAGFAEAG